MRKEVMELLNSFCFHTEIETYTHVTPYEMAMRRLSKITDVELHSYSTEDICNVIGDLLEDSDIDTNVAQKFVDVEDLELKPLEWTYLRDTLDHCGLKTAMDYHKESTWEEMINWKFEDSQPAEIIKHSSNIHDYGNILELDNVFYFFYGIDE